MQHLGLRQPIPRPFLLFCSRISSTGLCERTSLACKICCRSDRIWRKVSFLESDQDRRWFPISMDRWLRAELTWVFLQNSRPSKSLFSERSRNVSCRYRGLVDFERLMVVFYSIFYLEVKLLDKWLDRELKKGAVMKKEEKN